MSGRNLRQKKERIKLLQPRHAASPEIRARFKTEAFAQAGLKHTNVLMVHDVVEDENGLFLVMELAEGGSLSQRVSTSTLFQISGTKKNDGLFV